MNLIQFILKLEMERVIIQNCHLLKMKLSGVLFNLQKNKKYNIIYT